MAHSSNRFVNGTWHLQKMQSSTQILSCKVVRVHLPDLAVHLNDMQAPPQVVAEWLPLLTSSLSASSFSAAMASFGAYSGKNKGKAKGESTFKGKGKGQWESWQGHSEDPWWQPTSSEGWEHSSWPATWEDTEGKGQYYISMGKGKGKAKEGGGFIMGKGKGKDTWSSSSSSWLPDTSSTSNDWFPESSSTGSQWQPDEWHLDDPYGWMTEPTNARERRLVTRWQQRDSLSQELQD